MLTDCKEKFSQAISLLFYFYMLLKFIKNENGNKYELHWIVFLWCEVNFKMKCFAILSSKVTTYFFKSLV